MANIVWYTVQSNCVDLYIEFPAPLGSGLVRRGWGVGCVSRPPATDAITTSGDGWGGALPGNRLQEGVGGVCVHVPLAFLFLQWEILIKGFLYKNVYILLSQWEFSHLYSPVAFSKESQLQQSCTIATQPCLIPKANGIGSSTEYCHLLTLFASFYKSNTEGTSFRIMFICFTFV